MGTRTRPSTARSRACCCCSALDEILAEKIDPRYNLDAVEPKLFGIGSESYVIGSHEFYMGYAVSRQVLLTLDSGHFHPTETIADKLSAVMLYVPEVLLHVSRGVRWDSDHVVIFNDDLQAICQEIVRGGYLDRIHIGLDYFDASINRIAAWVIGSRNTPRRCWRRCSNRSTRCARWKTPVISPRGWPCWKKLKACPSRRSGITTA